MTSTQPVIAFDLDRDVRTVEAMAARLKPYVYENELYGLMPGDLPRLTIGGLLMRLHRLSALADHLSPKQQGIVQNAQQQLDTIRKEWGVAYEGKLQREFTARLNALGQFLGECHENPQRCFDGYPSAVEKRVIAHAIADEMEARHTATTVTRAVLTDFDNNLRRYVKPADHFVWDARLQPAYPRDPYWYLYVAPKE
ncbi:MAG: hypothetical protein IT324_17050 [Anaerolineae bacterium]|nr:hypothetical protein [Anaerolineae bacterium]